MGRLQCGELWGVGFGMWALNVDVDVDVDVAVAVQTLRQSLAQIDTEELL